MAVLLTSEEVADMIGVSVRELRGMRLSGTGPTPVFLSAWEVRYHPEQVSAWIDRQAEPTTEGKDNDS